MIADDAKSFLAAIKKCFSSKLICDQLGKEARKLIISEHSLEQVVKKLETFYQRILEKN